MVRASDKLSLLSAEAPIHQPVMTDGSAFFQLEEELRGAFEMTIVDIPRQVLIPFPHLVSEMGTILLISDVTLAAARDTIRSEEHTSELQSLMRLSYAVFCLKNKNKPHNEQT